MKTKDENSNSKVSIWSIRNIVKSGVMPNVAKAFMRECKGTFRFAKTHIFRKGFFAEFKDACQYIKRKKSV